MLFDTFEELVNELKNVSQSKKIYIWGSGLYGDLLGQFFNNNHIKWCGYYENHTNDDVKMLNGKKVFSGNDIDQNVEKIYVLSMRNFDPVKEQLMDKGIGEKNIFAFGTVNVFDELNDSVINNTEYSNQMRAFHNIHKDESCFVIGNGPSLTGEDLETICRNKMISFACNHIYRAYEKVSWRPDYYVIIDSGGIIVINDQLKYISENCKYMFSRSNGRLRNFADKIDNLQLFKSVFSESEEQVSFSEDCSKHLYIGHTVTYAMLQLAVYMGFKNIYLLGIDHQYAVEYVGGKQRLNNVKNHSYLLSEGEDVSGSLLIDKTTFAYQAAKKYADEHGVHIYNATRGGKLEVFERVEFDKLFR